MDSTTTQNSEAEFKAGHASTDRIIKDYLTQWHWNVLYALNISHDNKEGFYDASIDNMSWTINISLAQDFERRQVEIANELGLSHIGDPVRKVLYSAMVHEHGHWKIAPQGVLYAEMVLDAVSKGLVSAGLDEEKAKNLAPFVSNMYTDVLVNGVNLTDEEFREGRTLIFADRAYFSEKAKEVGKPAFEDYFAMFVDAQMKLTSVDKSRNLAEGFVEDYQSISGESKKLLGAVIGSDYAEKAFSNKLTDTDRRRIRLGMMDESGWRSGASEFARIIAPHIKEQMKDMQDSVCLNSFMSAMAQGNPVKQSSGQGSQSQSQKQGSEKGGKEPAGKDPEEAAKEGLRNEIIRQGLKRLSQEKGGSLAGIGPGEMIYADGYELMDAVYKEKAGEIVMQFLGNNGELPRTTLFNMSLRRLDEDEGIGEGVAWDRTMFVNGEPWLFKRETPFDIETPGASNTGSFEDILFAVDVSQSMKWTGTPLDGSKYDMCIRSIYSIINYLENSGKAQYLTYGLLLFSNETTWSGWTTYGSLNVLKEHLFTGFQNGGTVLSPSVLKRAVAENDQRFLAVITTDGDIQNTTEAVAACESMIKKPSDAVIFQVQSSSEFCSLMRGNGTPVIDVHDPEDLIGLNLSIVHSKYGTGTVEVNGSGREASKLADAKKLRMM